MWGHNHVELTTSGAAAPDLVWVPQQQLGMVQQTGQAAAPALQPGGPQGLPFAANLQAAPAPAHLPDGLAQLDSALLPPLPSLPMASEASAGGAGGAGGAAGAGTSSAATGEGEALDKQAVAREKNRLAQRRFREKERQKLAEAEAEAAGVRRQLTQLRLENERLQMEHALLEKLLVVRDAILSVVVQLDGQPPQRAQQPGPPQMPLPRLPLPVQQARQAPVQAPDQGQGQGASGGSTSPTLPGSSVAALLQDPVALQAASQQLAAALGELPSLEQMELMVAELGGDSGSGTDASHSSGGGGGSGGSSAAGSRAAAGATATFHEGEAAGAPRLSAAVGAAAASGVEVDSSRLQEVVPLPHPEVQREAEALDHVECLYEYWRQWRVKLREVFEEAQACNFSDRDQLEALEVHMRESIEVIWATCHVRPIVFNLYLARCLPPPDADLSAEWKRVAEQSLPMLSDSDVAFFRRAIQRYTRKAAMAAIGVRPWVQRLQALVGAQRGSPLSMSQIAGQHAQVREVAARLQRACTEQYLACLAFLSEVGAHCPTPVRCLWILSGGEFAPDHLAILNELVRLHQQRNRQQLGAPGQPASNATGQAQAQQAQAQAQSMHGDAAAGAAC